MSHGGIRLRVALAEEEAEYIRHARLQTLRAIGAHPHVDLTEPLPYAVYLFAYDGRGNDPVGMAEACFLEQHYQSYGETPYAPFCDLSRFCSFSQLAGIRTVYAEPAARLHGGLYLKLILGSAYIFRSFGARYSTATTNAEDKGLARLYDKTGGIHVTTFALEAFHEGAIALYLFDLDALLRHRGMPRTLRDLDLSTEVLRTARSRRRSAGNEMRPGT